MSVTDVGATAAKQAAGHSIRLGFMNPPTIRIPSAAEVAAAREKKRKRTDCFQPSGIAAEASAAQRAPAAGAAAGPSMPSHAANAAPNPPTAAPVPAATPVPAAAPAAVDNAPAAAVAGASANAIIVSNRQQGNPVLRQIRNVPWKFGDISADYLLSDTTCCLFLSLRYYMLHPGYLARRLRELSAGFTLRLLLLLVDSDHAELPVLEVTHAAHAHGCTTLCAWSVPEAARYLETLKAYAKKPADLIKERSDGNFHSQLADCFASLRAINRTDTATLQTTFGSLAAMVRATPQELTQCPGLGERKVQRLAALASDPFVPSRRGRDEPSTSSVRGVADA